MTGRSFYLWLVRSSLTFGLALLALALPVSWADEEADPEPPSRFPKTTDRDRARSINNLKEIALSLHNYHDANGALPSPAPFRDKNGKALLSWRVAILPYVEQDQLYKQFHFDEPWDSKHNKTLLAKMPDLFAPPIQGKPAKPNTTYYQLFTGSDAPFDADGKAGPRLTAFTDGTSNTALVIEAGDAVEWTKPQDLVYDAKKPLPKLGGLFADRFHVAFCDGHVRAVGRQAKLELLRAMITPRGGERFSSNDLPEPRKK